MIIADRQFWIAVYRDPRACGIIQGAFLVVSVAVIMGLGGYKSNSLISFNFGPEPNLKYIGVQLNTWAKWSMLMIFIMAGTFLDNWSALIVDPWITNVNDENDRDLRFNKSATLGTIAISRTSRMVWYVLTFLIVFTQIDFLVCRAVVEVLVALLTTVISMRRKAVAGEMSTSRLTLLEDNE